MMGKSVSKNPTPIVGAWKMISFEIQKENGELIYPFGEDARGLIVYTESGHMSVQLMRLGRPQFASGDQLKGTDKEIRLAYESMVSYYGSYEYNREKGYVIHHVEGSLFPNWIGLKHKRFFEFSGNRLILRTPPTFWGGEEIVAINVWERID